MKLLLILFFAAGMLASDHYLWLTGEAARMVRGNTPLSERMPEREGFDDVNQRTEKAYENMK